VVLRFETGGGGAWFALRDPNRNLLALYSDDLRGCAEPADEGYGVAQLVFTPAGPIHQLTHGEQGLVSVYDVTGNPARNCDFWTGVSGRLIAQGSADFNWLDNDLALSGPGANVFGPNSNGTLDNLVDGGKVQYNLKFRWRMTPDGSFARLLNDIKLTPDPR
jgi:hypothetical protein